MKSRLIQAATLAAILGAITCSTQAAISGISIPVNSSDATSHLFNDNVWSVSVPPAPFDTDTGIGFLINPAVAAPGASHNANETSLHDHVYLSANIPDPSRAVVTFQFDTATTVKGVEIIEHTNGVSRVEGYAGDALNSLVSLGSVFGPDGDVEGFLRFTEWSSQVFDFGNTTVAGKFFELLVRKTSLGDGWASYRIFPLDENGIRIAPAAVVVPIPAAFWLLGSALAGIGLQQRRRA